MRPPIDRENAEDAEFTVVQRVVQVAKSPLPWMVLVITLALVLSKAAQRGLLW